MNIQELAIEATSPPLAPTSAPTSAWTKLTWVWRGYDIQYTTFGQGKPLLLIHGFGASIAHWRQNIPVLAAAGYQVFAVDLLGFGGSQKPELDYTVELWEQQLVDFWTEKVQQPMVVVGNSIGGLLSLQLAAHHPEKIRGAVLINCAGGLNHRPEELNFPLRMVMGFFTNLVSSPTTGKFIFNQIRQKHRIRNTLKQVYFTPEAITEELVDLLYDPSCDPGAQQVFASVLTAPPGDSPGELLPQIHCPLLTLWGEEDPWTPIAGAKIYQDHANARENATFQAIPQAGHCPHDEKPAIVNALILDWLNKLN